MNPRLKRLTGAIMVLVASASLLFSLYCLVQTWRYKGPLASSLRSTLDLISTTLETTSEGLRIAEQSLDSVSSSLFTLQNSLVALGKSLEDSEPLLGSLEKLLDEDLPGTLTSMQASLASAQESARIIDTVLRAVSSIPFFPGEAYDPPIPLHLALASVSESMSSLPESFASMESSLGTTRSNTVLLKGQLNLVNQNIKQIDQNLAAAQQVPRQYQATIAILQAQLTLLQAQLPRWINTGAWMLSFIFLWLSTAQWSILIQGLALLR